MPNYDLTDLAPYNGLQTTVTALATVLEISSLPPSDRNRSVQIDAILAAMVVQGDAAGVISLTALIETLRTLDCHRAIEQFMKYYFSNPLLLHRYDLVRGTKLKLGHGWLSAAVFPDASDGEEVLRSTLHACSFPWLEGDQVGVHITRYGMKVLHLVTYNRQFVNRLMAARIGWYEGKRVLNIGVDF